MKHILIFSIALAFMIPSPAHAHEALAQTDALRIAPPTFLERVFEGLGTALTFGNKAKTERHLLLAERRLAETSALSEMGDARAEETALRYETHITKAQERAWRANNTDLIARVADNATRHITVLNEVLKRVPEGARGGVERALENAERLRELRAPAKELSPELTVARARLLAPSQKESETVRPPALSPYPVRIIPAPTSPSLPREESKTIRATPAPIPVVPTLTPPSLPREESEPARSVVPTSTITPTPVPVVTPTPTITPEPIVIPATPARVSAAIQGFAFSPASITVKKGTIVVWTNNDSVGHTVTGGSGGPDSRLLGQGDTYSFTFDNTGTFSYVCAPHPSMRGSVTVTE